jgi:hypothetical protein
VSLELWTNSGPSRFSDVDESFLVGHTLYGSGEHAQVVVVLGDVGEQPLVREALKVTASIRRR